MKVVYKAILMGKEEQELVMPIPYEVLSVGYLNGDIVVWYSCDPLEKGISRVTFICLETGKFSDKIDDSKYLGTVIVWGGSITLHIFIKEI